VVHKASKLGAFLRPSTAECILELEVRDPACRGLGGARQASALVAFGDRLTPCRGDSHLLVNRRQGS
jgi:hypothetical protein